MRQFTWLKSVMLGMFLLLLGVAMHLTAVGVMAAPLVDGPIIIDHTSTDITAIPQEWIEAAKDTLHIAYGHTSHGSQLISGMSGLVGFANGGGLGLALPEDIFAWNEGGTDGALDIDDYAMGGDVGYYPQWVDETHAYLGTPDGNGRGSNHPEVNVIMWSWCGQVNDEFHDTEQEMIDTYLAPMTALEEEYPGIVFIYMTGHAEGTGETGIVHLRNQQIREYAIANNKVLFDFYNIELYDPDDSYYGDKDVNDNCDYDSDDNGSLDANWATNWQGTHTVDVDWYSCSCAHSQSLNCNRKAYAIWALWARLAGWDGVPGSHRISVANGAWSSVATWAGGFVPATTDAVTIATGTVVTLDSDVQCHRITIEPGATLVMPAGMELTVADNVDNQGTLQQTATVDQSSAAFLEIADTEGFARYRGAEVSSPNTLGSVTVSLRVLGDGEYCTSSGLASPAYARRCFEITSSQAATATVRLWARMAEMNGVSTPRVFRYVEPSWVSLDAQALSGVYGDYAYAEAETPGFSHFLMAEDGSAPTAVRPVVMSAHSELLGLFGSIIGLALVLGVFFVVRKSRRKSRRDLR